jgi:Zn-dependent peptidase ImmA (M78 family)
LGHALLDPLRADAFGAASTRWAQETRRRRSGAFAAELLLPASALEEASHGHLDGVYADGTFVKLLERYNVGARTAAHQLYNNGWLSSTSLRDELIDVYAKEE